MPKLTGMVHRPQNRAQIYDFFPINKEMTKQFLIFVGYNVVFDMPKRGNTYIRLIFAALSLMVVSFADAQEHNHQSRALAERGDSLRAIYRFDESLLAYDAALSMMNDTLATAEDSLLKLEIQDKILMSENGRSMSRFVDMPNVVARRRFSVDDFFLYYPLRDSSWRALPNQLDSSANHSLAKAMYVRDDARTIYWSAEDNEGIRNIYTSTLRDTLWSLPSLLNEHLTSASDEIYPMPSPDGRSLFFSSTGLYGVGGYDIYVSRWNEDANDWDAPVNLGFPYSSPADDFLYIDTEDGHHSIFASNRECSKDSVWVYVLEYDNIPVRRSVSGADELREIAELALPEYDKGALVSPAGRGESVEVQAYIAKMREVKEYKDSVSHYAALAAEGKSASTMFRFRDMLAKAQGEFQRMEVDLMLKGIDVDPDKLLADSPVKASASTRGYEFVRKNSGAPLSLSVEVPKVLFDYSFKVLDEAQFAEDQTIPSGLVYQIQIFASKKKASVKALKGLSPVYEVAGSNGNLVYRIGLFRTYADVLSHLNTVKKVGFRNAFIVAFLDGKSLTVAKARAKEKEKPVVQEFYEVRMIPSGGELDSSVAAGIRQQAAGKDIARTVRADGAAVYVVGPFADKSKAEDLVLFIKAMGVSEVMCNVIQK